MIGTGHYTKTNILSSIKLDKLDNPHNSHMQNKENSLYYPVDLDSFDNFSFESDKLTRSIESSDSIKYNTNDPLYLSLYFIVNQFGGVKYKWTTLHHNGVLFPPDYIQHHVPIVYDGQDINLDKESEEVATLYAAFLGTEYIENKIFNRNFWNDFKRILHKNGHANITEFDKLSFNKIRMFLDEKKVEKKEMSLEEKAEEKEQKDAIAEKYKYCEIDGKKEAVGNFRVEIPSLFRGRGNNKSSGKLKRRLFPEDFTLNLSDDAPIPDPQIPGRTWGKIVHDRTVDWLASWKDPISGKTKYVWLSSTSELKSKNDIEKFETARKLKRKIKTIREKYTEDMNSSDIKLRQTATAVYLIDTFALRVGNEKGESDTADTVGVTSLRVEHLTLMDDGMIKFDFLGKDSIRYLNIAHVPDIVYNNLKDFVAHKTKDDQLFDKINSNDINKYLQKFMKNLTAKVFRTYNASNTFSQELKKVTKKMEGYNKPDKIKLLLEHFNKANIKVAKLCNHQKNVSKTFTQQIDKINDKITELKHKIKNSTPAHAAKIRKTIKGLKMKKQIKSETRNISLGTSKVNYIDPRITIAFIKQNDIPPEKLFTKALMDKFKWAFTVDKDFKF